MLYSERKINEEADNPKEERKKNNCIRWIVISIIVCLVVVAAITILVLILGKKKTTISDDKGDNKIQRSPEFEQKKLKKEFEIITNPGDLKRVSVVQSSIDETKLDGNLITTEIKRITNYDIYIISESNSDEDNKLFYSKMYKAAISIVSECLSTDGNDCEPQRLVDLTSEKKSNNNRRRVLNNAEDFKDIPIALCLFNITDNNFITSMTCPESLPDSKKNEMILDLYFFRPPAIQRADKENDNITITIKEDKENNRKYIRETNGGMCNVNNPYGTLCTTEMNTTTDLEGNLLKYDEFALTNITTDENNYYIKKKLTNLNDISVKIPNLDPSKYKKSLDTLLPLLEPHMKVDIHFTTDNFTDLYNVVQEKSKSKKKNYIKKKNQNRNLMQYASQFTKEQSLFDYTDIGGIQIALKLKVDSGLNTEAMRSYSNLEFDDKEEDKHSLSSLKEFTDIQIILDDLLELSKAGNHLASQLYEQIKDKLLGITNEITLKINTLNDLLMYKDLTEVFDSTLSLDSISKLPITIIEESNSLNNKLTKLFNGIKSGNVKNHVNNLGSNIFNYVRKLHILIEKIFNNLGALGNTLNSKNNKITEVTTYYLNHTSSSYIKTIEEAENILINYYKNEYDLIYPKIEQMLKEFEDNTKESLDKEKKIINNLYEKLSNKNFTIDLANDEDYKKIILNLYNSDEFITNIINKIKEYIKDEIGLKDSGYFISNYDINLNNKSFTPVLTQSKEVAQKLDKDEYIDKLFDRIMINFRENYTNIMKYMDKQKTEQFPLDENTLKDSLFTSNDRNKIETEMTSFRVEVSNKIKEENNFYIDKIKKYITNFITENLTQLNNLISDLNILFSEESLKQLSDLFNTAFYSCLNKITNDIKYNEQLATQYFDLINNGIKLNNVNYYNTWFWHYYYYYQKTKAYISKYNAFIANFDFSITYLKNQLYLDILKEYKTIITNIRERLQSIQNYKLTDKYPDFPELEFYNNHIRTVEKLYDRLNKYISDDLFNTKYLKPINDNIKANTQYVNSIKASINSKHKTINNLALYNDNKNDYCGGYKIKKCYGCTNCAWYYYNYYITGCHTIQYTNNHLSLIKSSIKSDSNLIIFNQKFNDFYSKINEKINEYNRRLTLLENNFSSIKKETLDKKITLNYLSPIQNSVNTVLSEKFGKEIVKASYNYYRKLIDERLRVILDNVSNKWINSYDTLLSEIEENYEDFKTSVYEFGVMAQIYETILSKNITRNYFNSIVLFQKTEFNYTISYYYNYYIKIVNEAYQYIISKIPKNENGFNDILDIRRKEIDEAFNSFLKIIGNSKNEALTYKNQTNILEVPETNFFKINSILTDNILNTSQILKEKRDDILEYIGEEGDDISLISRFYLENKENGKQIEQFYDPVNHEIFVFLNLEKFKNLMIENWIFDQDDFINKLNQTLYETTKEIKKEFSTKKDNYMDTLENEITRFFNDDSIENKINNLYLNEIKDFNISQKDIINTNINEIINKVNTIISSEATRIKTTSTSYNTNFSNIQNTIKDYKNNIFSKINSTVFNVLEVFYRNIKSEVYEKCIEEQLNEYLNEGKKATKDYEEYILLNSTFKVGEIIYNIIDDLVKNYKDITLKKINSKYNEYFKKIENDLNLNNIKNIINSQIDNTYNTQLLPALQQFAIYTPGDSQYSEYDFNNTIQTELDLTINEKIDNINNQILLTKGNNYEAKFECKLDYSLVALDIIIPICDSLQKFLSSEKQGQNDKINNLLQNIIKSNFNDLLNNIIPTFGNEFFERIIKYNQNFQIASLYDNLQYTLSQTLLYYITLNVYKDVDAIPKDLKNRLYNLNDLDSTVENKNKQILKLLDRKISEFIQESKINIMEKYMSYLQEDVSIERSFNSKILKKINDNLIQMQPEMEKKYQKMLEKYLKENLVDSYSKVMNDKTREMTKFVNEQREILQSKIDDLFSLDSDKVLYEVNEKINNTLDAINEYNTFFDTFSIPNNIKDFLNNYGSISIQPIFENFKIQLNKVTKDKIIQNIDKNAKDIENLNPNEFIEQANNMSTYFNTNYISNISGSINSYGIDDYQTNLDIERSRKRARLRRRLDGTQSEQEIAEDAYERIVDTGIEESFKNILSTSSNTKNYFDSLEAFNNFDKKLLRYKNNLNIAFKSSKELITKNEYEEEIENFLNEKLNNLTNITNVYYDKISQSYYNLRDFLNKSLIEIDKALNQCANITYKTFNKEYEVIANTTKKINTKYTNNTERLNTIKYTKKTEHKTNKVEADLSNFREYGEFKFDLVFEGNSSIKNPKISASIIDKSRPKTMNLLVSSPFGNCGENINQLDIEFNDANYTMNIDFCTNSTNINVTTFTHFEQYKYSREVYQIGEVNETQIVDAAGYEIEYKIKCKKSKEKVLQNTIEVVVDEKKFSETNIIQG